MDRRPTRRPEGIPHAPRSSNAARALDLVIGGAVAGLFGLMAAASGDLVLALVIAVAVLGVAIGWAVVYDRLPWLSGS